VADVESSRRQNPNDETRMMNQTRITKFKFIAIAVLILPAWLSIGCGVPGPAGPADTFGLDCSWPADTPVRGAVVFVVDGLNSDIFNAMLDKGQLPAFKKYFVDRGIYAPRAIANVPSVTLANLTSIVTGQFPGHTNITGINWFDRNQLIWRDYSTIAQKNMLDQDYTQATIFEQLPDEATFSIFLQPHRGATAFFEDRLTAGPLFMIGAHDAVDRLTLSRMGQVMDLSRRQGRFPALTVFYLLAPDFAAYQYGASSDQYRQALLHTDRQIGRVLGDLARCGMLDKLTIAMVSDHGHQDVGRHFSINKFLRDEIGLTLNRGQWWENDPFEDRLEDFQDVTAVPYGSGDRYWALCMRCPKYQDGKFAGWHSWQRRPTVEDLHQFPAHKPGHHKLLYTVDLPTVLIDQPAVDLVAYRSGDGRLRVVTKAGIAEFRQDAGPGGLISYDLITGTDPLGWVGQVSAEALAGRGLTGRGWLGETVGTQYPDLPAQLLAYFQSNRSGDICVFAAPGWDFGRANRSGHGGLGPKDIAVPMAIAGPNIPHTRLNVARTVDLMPTLLGLLGRPIPTNLDGQNLLDAGSK
jgi:hypothetical protein